jgi:site-specific DNA-methyltransferase (adenine-specific)
MASLPEASVDAIVTDPPYGLRFMGKEWDNQGVGVQQAEWHRRWAVEALRVLKPGGHLLAFGGSRTYHHLATAVEVAGFEVRDQIMWLYGSGFPKSHDVSKAIDKAAGAKREGTGSSSTACEWLRRGEECQGHGDKNGRYGETVHALSTIPATAMALQWSGWGTALKPAHEPIVVARKPLEGTVAANVLEHGTGAINIDGGRIPVAKDDPVKKAVFHNKPIAIYGKYADKVDGTLSAMTPPAGGRWPANVILDEEAGRLLDEQTGTLTSGANPTRRGSDNLRNAYGDFEGQRECTPARGADTGGASRFFYCAKAGKKEREAGLAEREAGSYEFRRDGSLDGKTTAKARNHHPTVKPIALMRYLVRLVTPPNGLVLDPFNGSGTTGIAAVLEGFNYHGLELSAEYAEIARARIAHHEKDQQLDLGLTA